MWRRIFREVAIEFYWLKKEILRYWKLDTPTGVMGILTIISGIALLVVIAQGATLIFQSFIPYVSGPRMGQTYWSSVSFGIKVSLTLMLFFSSFIIFLMLKLFRRR
ncbi:MAG: hypothetical protein ACYDEJ_14245 [Desulfitobacteriaceae bacterium]